MHTLDLFPRPRMSEFFVNIGKLPVELILHRDPLSITASHALNLSSIFKNAHIIHSNPEARVINNPTDVTSYNAKLSRTLVLCADKPVTPYENGLPILPYRGRDDPEDDELDTVLKIVQELTRTPGDIRQVLRSYIKQRDEDRSNDEKFLEKSIRLHLERNQISFKCKQQGKD